MDSSMTDRPEPPPLRELSTVRQRQLRQHLLREIAGPPDDARPLGVWRRRFAHVAVAAAVFVLVLLAATFAFRGATDTASAARVREKVAEGLEFRHAVSGSFEVEARDPGPPPRGAPRCLYCAPQLPLPSTFVVGSDGSYVSLTVPADAANRRDVAYDTTTGVETSFATPIGPTGRPIYLRAVNLDPVLLEYAPEARLGIWMQGALTDDGTRVSEVVFDGRAAWKATATFEPGESLYGLYGARVDVVVDQGTGLVLQVTQYAYDPGRWTSIATVRDLEIGEPTGAVDFTVPKPSQAVERFHDYRFRRVPVEAAAATIGYRPLLPSDTGGRPLTDFAIAKETHYPFPGLPARHDVASARYGSGAASITVSTYRGPVSDLTMLLPGDADNETVHPAGGPLVDSVAYVSKPTLSAAVFAAFADGLLVRITAPTTEQALAAASSLRPAG
jgi:hypothetical protein